MSSTRSEKSCMNMVQLNLIWIVIPFLSRFSTKGNLVWFPIHRKSVYIFIFKTIKLYQLKNQFSNFSNFYFSSYPENSSKIEVIWVQKLPKITITRIFFRFSSFRIFYVNLTTLKKEKKKDFDVCIPCVPCVPMHARHWRDYCKICRWR